jgi:hypothetical protein
MIIDCYCHAGEGNGLTSPWDTRASLRSFLRWSEEAGIARRVLFPAFHTNYLLAKRAGEKFRASARDGSPAQPASRISQSSHGPQARYSKPAPRVRL